MNAVLIRHTRIVVPAGLCYDWHDVPLAESFPGEADGVIARLPWKPRLVLASPASRCQKLAHCLADGAPVRTEERLRELHMGEWEGRLWESFRSPESEAWALDPWNRRPPGGETAAEFWARVDGLRAEMKNAGADRVAVVTHAGVIRAWLGLARGRTLSEVMQEPVPFGSVCPAE